MRSMVEGSAGLVIAPSVSASPRHLSVREKLSPQSTSLFVM